MAWATPRPAATTAASLLAQAGAAAKGCDQVCYLDAVEHRWVEELGGMNLYFVYGDRIVTPTLTGSILEGVTTDFLLTVARDLGYEAEEGAASPVEQWQRDSRRAAPYRGLRLRYRGGDHPGRHGEAGRRPVAAERGRARRGDAAAAGRATGHPARHREDKHGWMHRLV